MTGAEDVDQGIVHGEFTPSMVFTYMSVVPASVGSYHTAKRETTPATKIISTPATTITHVSCCIAQLAQRDIGYCCSGCGDRVVLVSAGRLRAWY